MLQPRQSHHPHSRPVMEVNAAATEADYAAKAGCRAEGGKHTGAVAVALPTAGARPSRAFRIYCEPVVTANALVMMAHTHAQPSLTHRRDRLVRIAQPDPLGLFDFCPREVIDKPDSPGATMIHFTPSGLAKAYVAVAELTIITITGLEVYALSQGVNGTALTASLATIAGLGGAGIGRLFK